jgi:WD40 repeat protein
VLLDNTNKNNVFDLAFSPDGQTLVTADQTHALTLWNVADHKKRAHLPGHGSHNFAVAYSPDGKSLASGGHDETIMLGTQRQAEQPLLLRIWSSTSGTGSAIQLFPRTANFWPPHLTVAKLNSGTWKHVALTLVSALRICPVAFSPDGRTLLTRSPWVRFSPTLGCLYSNASDKNEEPDSF